MRKPQSPPLPLSFGALMRHYRTEAKYTLRQLGEEVGISTPYIHDVEHGRRGPFTPERIDAAGKALMLTTQQIEHLQALATAERNLGSLTLMQVCRALTMRFRREDVEPLLAHYWREKGRG